MYWKHFLLSADSEKRVIIRPMSDPTHEQVVRILEAFQGMAMCTNRIKSKSITAENIGIIWNDLRNSVNPKLLLNFANLSRRGGEVLNGRKWLYTPILKSYLYGNCLYQVQRWWRYMNRSFACWYDPLSCHDTGEVGELSKLLILSNQGRGIRVKGHSPDKTILWGKALVYSAVTLYCTPTNANRPSLVVPHTLKMPEEGETPKW